QEFFSHRPRSLWIQPVNYQGSGGQVVKKTVLRCKKSNPKVLQWELEQDYEFRQTLPMYMFWFSQTSKSNIKKHIFLL
ncbi:hypothetical protein ABKV19_024977, partial [Rosa sericea]